MVSRKRPPVDCDAGRELGCQTFCCRLLVRLQPGERDPSAPDRPDKRFVDKDPATGLCANLDPETSLCRSWDSAPRWCVEYDCNEDPRLQSVLRHGFVSITRLSEPVYRELPPIRVPYRQPAGSDGPPKNSGTP
jgi:hypothetical protein